MFSVIRKLGLTQWILIAMVLGVLAGWLFPGPSQHLGIIADVFIRMIKSIIAPLLFSTLVVGIAGHGDDLKAVGRLALRSLIYFEIITTLAFAIGLAAVNLVRPGKGVSLGASAADAQKYAKETPAIQSLIKNIVPESFVDAAARNDMLQVVFFTILFGIALAQVRGEPKATVLRFCEALAQVMFKLTGLVMLFAPLGVGAAIAKTVSTSGLGVMIPLGKLVATYYGTIAVFLVGVLVPVMLLARIPIKRFARAVREPALLAFSTASSEAALPAALEETRAFGVPDRIVAFVLPTGYSFNLAGSALYLAIATIFIAQAASLPLDWKQQAVMMLTLMLTSKGVAGVARSSLVILSGMAIAFHLPLEGVAVLLGVDAILDAGRAAVNVIGNCLAAAVMARWEGNLETPPQNGT